VRDEEVSKKRSKFTEAQIAFLLKQVEDGASLADTKIGPKRCHQKSTLSWRMSMPLAQKLLDVFAVTAGSVRKS